MEPEDRLPPELALIVPLVCPAPTIPCFPFMLTFPLLLLIFAALLLLRPPPPPLCPLPASAIPAVKTTASEASTTLAINLFMRCP